MKKRSEPYSLRENEIGDAHSDWAGSIAFLEGNFQFPSSRIGVLLIQGGKGRVDEGYGLWVQSNALFVHVSSDQTYIPYSLKFRLACTNFLDGNQSTVHHF